MKAYAFSTTLSASTVVDVQAERTLQAPKTDSSDEARHSSACAKDEVPRVTKILISSPW